MKIKSIAECSPWSILQYIWPALSDNWYWKPIFVFLREAVLQSFYCIYVMDKLYGIKLDGRFPSNKKGLVCLLRFFYFTETIWKVNVVRMSEMGLIWWRQRYAEINTSGLPIWQSHVCCQQGVLLGQSCNCVWLWLRVVVRNKRYNSA